MRLPLTKGSSESRVNGPGSGLCLWISIGWTCDTTDASNPIDGCIGGCIGGYIDGACTELFFMDSYNN